MIQLVLEENKEEKTKRKKWGEIKSEMGTVVSVQARSPGRPQDRDNR